jgi:succinate-acetate transporter protein
VVFAFGILWLAKVTLLLLLTVMLSQERSLKRRYSETLAVCVFLAFWCVFGG